MKFKIFLLLTISFLEILNKSQISCVQPCVKDVKNYKPNRIKRARDEIIVFPNDYPTTNNDQNDQDDDSEIFKDEDQIESKTRITRTNLLFQNNRTEKTIIEGEHSFRIPKLARAENISQYRFHESYRTDSCPKTEGRRTKCFPIHKCASDFYSDPNWQLIRCNLKDGEFGVCCPSVKRANDSLTEVFTERSFFIRSAIPRHLNKEARNIIQNAVDGSLEDEIKRDVMESKLFENKITVRKGTSSHGHLQFFKTTDEAINLSKLGLKLLSATKEISVRLNLNAIDLNGMNQLRETETSLNSQCKPDPDCRSEFNRYYRSENGSCNNRLEPKYGQSLTTLMRILPPEYANGLWEPRMSTLSLKEPLPSARLVSSSLVHDVDEPSEIHSLYVMQFGQFIDHDLSNVPIFRFANKTGISCCDPNGDFLPLELTHPHCMPINISTNDPFYRSFRQKCMHFVRSMIGPRIECDAGYGDQINQVTHWLDSSNVYGSNEEESRSLREMKFGFLKTIPLTSSLKTPLRQRRNKNSTKGTLPIQIEEAEDECTDIVNGVNCFKAGDSRVNEMIGLTVTHLLWLREHNRIAMTLGDLNPQWNDDQLYHEARKILNAEYNFIIYNEWLPIIIGKRFMEAYGILPLTTGYSNDYTDTVNPSVSNSFTSAAFRMGHSLIQGLLKLHNAIENEPPEELVLHEHFNNPFRIRESGMVDRLLRSLTRDPIQKFDPFITTEVTNRLFERRSGFGLDLISLNIQRARDHGVPGYNKFREVCKLGRVWTFEGFEDVIPTHIVNKLKKLYKHVDDVDLFIGGISERPQPGSILGPTFGCIIGDQFARSKKGDRFAYDLTNQDSSFTPAQLAQIRSASFARIMCDNGDSIRIMQPLAFHLPNDKFNPLLDCESNSIPRMNLSYWKF